MRRQLLPLLVTLLAGNPMSGFTFSSTTPKRLTFSGTPSLLHMSTFAADSSDYSSKDSDYSKDDEQLKQDSLGGSGYRDDSEDINTVELQPIPMSKNAGNRFVLLLWDRLLDQENRNALQLHEERIELTEDHVMNARKANLYNETFNTESMVDVMWSRQILSSDLQRVIGQAMCLESTRLDFVKDFVRNEPLVQWFTGGNEDLIAQIPLYRWRHYRDYTLRIDDGRNGTPCMTINLDYDAEDGIGNLRQETNLTHLEYLIRSERVIAAGSLHLPTEFKDDPSSLAVGDLVMYNAKDREDAIAFAESDPRALTGLYKTMQVHFYNSLDVTGKFVAEDELRDAPCADLKEAMEVWGYPVGDDQTPWLNG